MGEGINMRYQRRYIQFNDLVFDGYDMISDADGGVSFKATSQSYSYKHGSYVAFKRGYMLADEQTISMTLRLYLKKVPCEMREFYRDFAIEQLTKPGKLWAVQNNTIVWAYAYISNFAETPGYEKDVIEIDVDFVAYEGVWHKADKTKTFLKPYDLCTFLLCKGYKNIDPCAELGKDCCIDCVTPNDVSMCCCDCLPVEKEWSLCYMKGDLQDYYKRCNGGFQIEYNCQKGHEFFGEHLGTKICRKDPCSSIAGQLYSDTDIPTNGVTVTLTGGAVDPWITINGNTNVIKGEYNGTLTITQSDIIHTVCGCETVLDPSVLIIPDGNTLGWEIHKGNNQVFVDTCCGTVCAYIEVDSLTI